MDRDILAGVPFRVISRRLKDRGYGIEHDSVRRHFLNHLSDEAKQAAAESFEVDSTNLILEIAAIADRSKQAELIAYDRGKLREAVHAGNLSLRVYTSMIERLGITDKSIVQGIEQATQLIGALQRVMKEHPELAPLLIQQLDDDGADELAEGVREFAEKYLPPREITQ